MSHDQAEGILLDIYNSILTSNGEISDMHRIQSLNPASIKANIEMYMTIMCGDSPLDKETREIIGLVVSDANNCNYCVQYQADMVNECWNDEERVSKLKESYMSADLEPKVQKIAQYALYLTRYPDYSSTGEPVTELKNAGLTDREILDVTLITSYFNFVNRLTLALGVRAVDDSNKIQMK